MCIRDSTTTVDNAGNELAQKIHQDNKYVAVYDAGTKILRITSVFNGVAFSTSTITGTSNISISNANLIQTSAVFEITGIPSSTNSNPQTYNYILQPIGPSCVGGAVNFEGAITVNPISFGSHIAASGAENQISCDGTAITPIQYNLIGASNAMISSGSTTFST